MITIKSKNYNRENIQFLIHRFNTGLSACWVHKEGKFDSEPCWECIHRTACYDMESSLAHLYALYYKSEVNSEK